tara:strand:+ start:315 stop:905 length:591 start_codon:yes stop_codon:yes gene_type:complete
MATVNTICGRQISKSNISKHRKRCSACKTNKIEQRHEEILNEIALLRQKIENTPQIIHNHNTFVNIIPFSKEPTLSEDVVRELLEPADESVPKYVKLKHFVKAGGNIRIPNKSQKRIEVFEEENGEKLWITKDRDDFIKNLTGMSINELDEVYGASKISQNYKEWVSRFNDSDRNTQQKLDNKVLYTILDNSKNDK